MVRVRAFNRRHAEDDLPKARYGSLTREMPDEYRSALEGVKGRATGRKALGKYKSFWGLPYPTEILELDNDGPNVDLIGAGRTTGVYLTDAPTPEQASKKWSIKKKGNVAFDTAGRKIFVLNNGSQKGFGKGLKFVGFARETHYIPTNAMEDAGTFKSGKYWVHKHDDEGGKFPKVFKDRAGNFIYAPGTMRIGKWLRR